MATKPKTKRIYTGGYLSANEHLVTLLTRISKYDEGLPPEQRYYKDNEMFNVAQRTINRAEALQVAVIDSDGKTTPTIPPE